MKERTQGEDRREEERTGEKRREEERRGEEREECGLDASCDTGAGPTVCLAAVTDHVIHFSTHLSTSFQPAGGRLKPGLCSPPETEGGTGAPQR